MHAFVGFCSTLSARDHATELIAAEPAHIKSALHPGFPVWQQYRTDNLRPIINTPGPLRLPQIIGVPRARRRTTRLNLEIVTVAV
jgi:hypothetical protein